MKTQTSLTITESFAVPPEVLFEALLDHEGMSEWLDARISVVRGPEDGGGGVGTVRRIHLPIGGLDEEVVYVLPPRRLVYRIVRGAPFLSFHRGEMLVEPWGETGAQLTWDIRLDSPVPGLSAAVAAGLKQALRKGLSKLRILLTERASYSSSSDAGSDGDASAIGNQPKR